MKKVIKITALAVSLALAVLIPVNALSKMGSAGGEVSQIQSVLKDEGYYTGSIDEIFGTKTKNAVIAFQKANGLTADGIVGSATLSALNITQSNVYNSADYEPIADSAYSAARDALNGLDPTSGIYYFNYNFCYRLHTDNKKEIIATPCKS